MKAWNRLSKWKDLEYFRDYREERKHDELNSVCENDAEEKSDVKQRKKNDEEKSSERVK
jgi:hypothetical protein